MTTEFALLQLKDVEPRAMIILTAQQKNVLIVTGQEFVYQEENAIVVVRRILIVIEFRTVEIVSIMNVLLNVDKLVNIMDNVKTVVIYVGVVIVFLEPPNSPPPPPPPATGDDDDQCDDTFIEVIVRVPKSAACSNV
eukprot:CAMPEP_0117034092 /NCGR_PEP_ID=MMETSP0472-20121206/24304_1 /TAXON_ID=693140 ORGANISM="Tiarina fusus, Strain LIS" /NCGR_SAMPLE_ID=MMETSP0472 /ASSEMBLY_ACC=CAM_ASM_000603 /LENGTH=136 /DNA_ID=CAMNT_0004743179 /DNA_START=260 /DNA_END=669 /DNA_ORIENTATION=+